ncbi:MAG: ABC transporter permease [Armatimonadetes bacterium]|nr:ABC transporter permease [Armatimonadota bacterium]
MIAALGAAARSTAAAVFVENRPAVLGTLLVVLIGAAAAFAPALTPHNPLRGVASGFAAPSWTHPFGTDDLGRDVFSQVLYGTRVSLLVGFTSAAIASIIGVAIGAAAGFAGGLVDDALMRVTELFQVIPRIFLSILLVALFGQTLAVTTIAIGILSWPATARVVRAEYLSKRELDYVTAARSFGAGPFELMFREILPNTLGPVIVTSSLLVGSGILLEAGLAFIGLSDPNVVSLGRLIYAALPLMRDAWWMSVFPGVFLSLVVLGFNLIGDGLSDVLNPRLHR